MKRKIKYKITNITRRMIKGYQNFLKMVYPEWSRAKIRAKAQRHFYWRFINVPQNRLFFTSNSGIGVLDHEFVDQGILSIKSCDSSLPATVKEFGGFRRGELTMFGSGFSSEVTKRTEDIEPAALKLFEDSSAHHRYKLSPTGLNPRRNHPFDNLVLPEKPKADNFNTHLKNVYPGNGVFDTLLEIDSLTLVRDDETLNELRLMLIGVDGMDTSHAPVLKLDVSYDYAATPPQGEVSPLTEIPPPFEIPVMPPQTFTVTRKDGMIVDKDTLEKLNFKRYLSIPRATGGVASKNQDLYGDLPFKPYTVIPKVGVNNDSI